MTIRNTKRLLGGLMALLVLVTILNVAVTLWKAPAKIDYFEFALPLFLVLIFATTWKRLSLQEAEHGPDYVPPTAPSARKLLVMIGLIALVLGAVVGYLALAHH